jgi:hypothetical protein
MRKSILVVTQEAFLFVLVRLYQLSREMFLVATRIITR